MIMILKFNFQVMLKVISQLYNPPKKFAIPSQMLCFQVKTIGIPNLVYASVFSIKIT